MKITKWNGSKVFGDIYKRALENGNSFMDQVVKDAKARCPVGTITREGKFAAAHVSFTPKTGRNKGIPVDFGTQFRWYGREPGNLRDTIRRTNIRDSGSIRVYAGNYKIYWAFMVERGTSKSAAQPFLRPAFFAAKARALRAIKKGSK